MEDNVDRTLSMRSTYDAKKNHLTDRQRHIDNTQDMSAQRSKITEMSSIGEETRSYIVSANIGMRA